MNEFRKRELRGAGWLVSSSFEHQISAGSLEKLVPEYQPSAEQVIQQRKGHVSWVDQASGTFIKKYYPRNLANRLQYSFRANRAQNEFSSGNRLRELGVPVPDLLAYGQYRQLGTWQCSYLVYRYYPGHTSLGDLDWNAVESGELAGPLAREVAGMHNSGVYFGDLHAGNILAGRSASSWELLFTDFDKTRIYDKLPETLWIDDLARLNGFIDCSIEQRIQFLIGYCRTRKLSAVRDLYSKVNHRTEQLWHKRRQRLGVDERKYPAV